MKTYISTILIAIASFALAQEPSAKATYNELTPSEAETATRNEIKRVELVKIKLLIELKSLAPVEEFIADEIEAAQAAAELRKKKLSGKQLEELTTSAESRHQRTMSRINRELKLQDKLTQRLVKAQESILSKE